MGKKTHYSFKELNPGETLRLAHGIIREQLGRYTDSKCNIGSEKDEIIGWMSSGKVFLKLASVTTYFIDNGEGFFQTFI